MVPCRADTGNDAFADAGDDRRFTGAADKSVDVGTDCDPGPDFQLNAILATAEMNGVSMTFGLTLIWTASRTSRPAKSIAQARSKVKDIVAR